MISRLEIKGVWGVLEVFWRCFGCVSEGGEFLARVIYPGEIGLATFLPSTSHQPDPSWREIFRAPGAGFLAARVGFPSERLPRKPHRGAV